MNWEELNKEFHPKSMQELPDTVWLSYRRMEPKMPPTHKDAVFFTPYENSMH